MEEGKMIARRNFLRLAAGSLPVAVGAISFSSVSFAGEERAPLTASAGPWKSLASLPFPVQEIYPAINGKFIHVAGGLSPNEAGRAVPTRAHIQYNIASNAWRSLASLPEACHHIAMGCAGERVFALGGFRVAEGGEWSMSAAGWKYDAVQDGWESLPAAPEVHAESVTLAIAEVIHVVGGRKPRGDRNAGWMDHIDSNRHLVFDTASQTWTNAAPAKYARNSAAGAVINGQLYVVGGRTVSGGNVAYLEIYDPVEDRWRDAAPMPQAQGGLAAAAVNGALVACGGEFFGADGVGVHGDCWRYDPAKDSWDSLPPMQTPRHGLGAVSDGKNFYALGGATQVATRGTSNLMEVLGA